MVTEQKVKIINPENVEIKVPKAEMDVGAQIEGTM